MLRALARGRIASMEPETLTGSPVRPSPRRQRSAWSALGLAVAVILVIGGLAAVGAIVVFCVGMSNYGSNK
jgi:hypothetical protein